MRIEIDAMRWLAWKAASQLEHGLDATREAQLARIYCARQAMKIADDGVQVLGGHGFIREHPVETVVPQRAHARRPRRRGPGLGEPP